VKGEGGGAVRLDNEQRGTSDYGDRNLFAAKKMKGDWPGGQKVHEGMKHNKLTEWRVGRVC